jgi:hypothetical protein
MAETIILICTVVGTLIADFSYRAATSGALKEAKTILLEKFEFLKSGNNGKLFVNPKDEIKRKNRRYQIQNRTSVKASLRNTHCF